MNTPTNYYYGYNILKGWFPGWGGWYGSSTDVKVSINELIELDLVIKTETNEFNFTSKVK